MAYYVPPRRQRITRLFCNMVLTGRFHLEGLNTNFFSPTDCAMAYDMASTHRDRTMGIVFDWTNLRS